MKNIHILPTDKPSRLHIWVNNKGLRATLYEKPQLEVPNTVPKNIYIISDEEIKDGDVVKIPCGVGKVKKLNWKFGNDNPSYIVEDIFIYKLRYGQKEGELQINSFRYEDVKKIILTTDQDLINDGVQAVYDEFLEWFVKNPNCEEVEVVDVRSLGVYGSYYPYKINIPKKETKQETVKEAAEKFYPPKTTDLICSPKLVRDSFIAGAKWQQKQSKNLYSEEDLREAFRQGEQNISYSETYGLDSKLTEQEWFEQFKKK